MEEKIKQFEVEVDAEILRLERRINHYKEIKLMLNSQIIKGDNVFNNLGSGISVRNIFYFLMYNNS